MSTTTISPVLQVRRVFDASPEAVFDAWLRDSGARLEWRRED
jgi:uncharacterized protein YndB with AHSA1/START domain